MSDLSVERPLHPRPFSLLSALFPALHSGLCACCYFGVIVFMSSQQTDLGKIYVYLNAHIRTYL